MEDALRRNRAGEADDVVDMEAIEDARCAGADDSVGDSCAREPAGKPVDQFEQRPDAVIVRAVQLRPLAYNEQGQAIVLEDDQRVSRGSVTGCHLAGSFPSTREHGQIVIATNA